MAAEIQVPGTPSYWHLSIAAESIHPVQLLREEIDVDFLIVGGGFTGLSAARFLKESCPNLRIALIEQYICGGGASGRNTGYCNRYII